MFFSHIPQWLYRFTTWYILPVILFRAALILWYRYKCQRHRPQPILRTDQDAPIYKLPPEMIQHIASFLQSSSVAVFVLSNKYFLAVLGTQFLKVEKPDRLHCLKALQQQAPNYLLCHACVSFHPRRRHRSGSGRRKEPKCFRESGVFQCGLRGDFELLFPDIQQIMNRHRFGEHHGFSVKEISYRWSGELSSYSVFTTESADAVISDDNLLLRTESRCKFSWLNNQAKMLAVYAPIKFCPHFSDNDLNLFSFSTSQMTFVKCSGCMTEIRIRIRNVNALEREVETTSWYNLGSCREPFDSSPLQWKELTEKSTRRSLIYICAEETVYRNAYNLSFYSQ